MPRVEIEVNQLKDVDVKRISLVKRGANQIPIRLTKSDEEGDKPMLQFEKLLRKSRASAPAAIVGVAVLDGADVNAVKALMAEHAPTLKCDLVEKTDGATLIFKAEGEDLEKSFPVKVGDELVLMFKLAKAFDSYPGATDFITNIETAGFYPSLRVACDVMTETAFQIMFKSTSPEDAAEQLKKAGKQFADYLAGMAQVLPAEAFKIDKAVAEKMTCKGAGCTVKGCKGAYHKNKADEEAAAKAKADADAKAAAEAKVKADAELAQKAAEEAAAKGAAGTAELVKQVGAMIAAALNPITATLASVQAGLGEVQKTADEAKQNAAQATKVLKGTVAGTPAGDPDPTKDTEEKSTKVPLLDTAVNPVLKGEERWVKPGQHRNIAR